MNEQIEKALEQIAMESSFALEERGGLDTRNSDSEDFIEVSIWSIWEMLKKAYELGRAEH